MKMILSYLIYAARNFSRKIIRSESGESAYFILGVALVLGIIYIAMPGTFHDFFEYMIDFVFDSLHSAFGDNPKSDFGAGQKGDAENPLFDGIKLPGDEGKNQDK